MFKKTGPQMIFFIVRHPAISACLLAVVIGFTGLVIGVSALSLYDEPEWHTEKSISGLSAAAAGGPNASQTCSPVSSGNFDRTHLPPIRELPPGISWMSDWSAQPKTGGWYEMQAMDTCRFQTDPNFPTWHNRASARVEVDPSDDPLEAHDGSERSEVLLPQTPNGAPILESPSSGSQFYATSFYFPKSWGGTQYPWSGFAPKDCSAGDQNQCNSWSIVMQFHLAGSRPWGFLYAAKTKPSGPQQYTFLLGKTVLPFADGGAIALGKWTDFIFQFRWDVNRVSAWRRDQGQTDFKPVVEDAAFTPPSEAVYLKQGLYRGGAVDSRTDVLWIGPTARGESFSAVETAAFGEGR